MIFQPGYTFSHLMLGEDLCSWVTQEVGWTEDFRWICNLALEEATPPIEDEDREATSNALSFLLKEVTRGAPTMRYTASDLRRSQEDRDNWSLFYQQPPSLPAPVARWRHWKPRQLQETDPITQRQLEKELRLKWAQRLICLLAPFADKIPNMASVMGKDQEREWIDLLGDTRFRTQNPLFGLGKPPGTRILSGPVDRGRCSRSLEQNEGGGSQPP